MTRKHVQSGPHGTSAEPPSMALALAQARPSMRISPHGRIRIVFEASLAINSLEAESDRSLRPFFECLGCEALLEWQPARLWWCCPSCGMELTAAEANEYVDHCQRLLSGLFKDEVAKNGGRSWGLVGWLLRLLRLKGASNS